MPDHRFQTAAVIGLGLIGSSLAAAFQNKESVSRILGYDICSDTVSEAEEVEFIDESYHSACSRYPGLEEADLIIISVPVRRIPEVLADIKECVKKGAVIVDTGSCKGFIMEEARKILKSSPDIYFMGGHPVAGSEKCGIKSCDPGIFVGADFILTPPSRHSPPENLSGELRRILEITEFNVRFMSPQEHDRYMALISHLPQLVAYALAGALQEEKDLCDLLEIAGDGFFDTTRIAASSPELWKDIALSNREEILHALDCFQSSLEQIKSALKGDKSEELEELFAGSARVRRKLGQIRREKNV